jgi:hypothetical protein
MTHRNRNALAALLAAGLLVLSSATALAFGGRPGGSPPPSMQPQQSHRPVPSQSLPTNANGHGRGGIDCSNLPTPAPSGSAATNTPGLRGQSGITWGWRMGVGWLRDLDAKNIAACTTDSLQRGLDNRIAMLIATLGDAKAMVGTIKGLDSTQQATLIAEIDGAIGDLQALKTKIDGDAKGSGLAADLKALQRESLYVRAIVLQIRLLNMAGDTLAQISALGAQATALASQLAAAPSGVDTARAQKFLDDMNAMIADAQKLASPLPGILLGLTPAQLQAGKGDPVIAAAIRANWQAAFDIFKATQDGRMVKAILSGSI